MSELNPPSQNRPGLLPVLLRTAICLWSLPTSMKTGSCGPAESVMEMSPSARTLFDDRSGEVNNAQQWRPCGTTHHRISTARGQNAAHLTVLARQTAISLARCRVLLQNSAFLSQPWRTTHSPSQ